MKIENFDPALRTSLLEGINEIEDNYRQTLPNVVEMDEEELDLEDFKQRQR